MARRFASSGWHVLQIDLLGCGDSEGDFADASWSAWLDDVDMSVRWLRQRCNAAPMLWGFRAGALLCSDWAARQGESVRCLFWQPVTRGASHLQQFLRIRAMSGLGTSERGEGGSALRERLRAEGSMEIGGYQLSAGLADSLEKASLEGLPAGSTITWLEVVNRPEPAVNAGSVAQIERLRAAGVDVEALAVAGPSFWQSVELEDAPQLRDATARLLGISEA